MMHFKSFRSAKTTKLHTNGIAHVASNSSIGASTSAQSFAERQQVDSYRQHVASYNSARIYNERKHPPKRVAPLKTIERFMHPVAPTNPHDPAGGTPQTLRPTTSGSRAPSPSARTSRPYTGFRDAPSRGYNPYA